MKVLFGSALLVATLNSIALAEPTQLKCEQVFVPVVNCAPNYNRARPECNRT